MSGEKYRQSHPSFTPPKCPPPPLIVLCALNSGIGKPAWELLLPVFSPDLKHSLVTHFIQSLSAAQCETPHLLAGQDPQSPHANDVGTKYYSWPVRAILFGRGLELEDIEALRVNVACISQDPVLWIAGDPSRKHPLDAVPPPNYHQLVTGVARNLLGEWVEVGATSIEVILY
ncbi:uncharacterized protein N7500_006140 [Penicillium coprophilum]|uniref:uncharacterized protein n=1 Tax=Penicillium coprophilum TaxID=36646 RepID=UPI0023846EDC|nr:uncharacterized protein N7500_006140 [Penicillium coprophilum]KAJ5164310.1 hypothetical protein N7500_006140 [Penicillium coprophilum]